jgi:pyruvate kinase
VRTGDALLLVRQVFRPLADWPVQFRTSLGDALAPLAPGAEVWLDDGKLASVVERRDGDDLVLRVTEAGTDGYRLKPEKGVNLPGTRLDLPPLTAKDRDDLGFACRHADMIGYSFVQHPDDIVLLQEELRRQRPDDWRRLGVVAKIETAAGIEHLPDIVVRAAGAQPFGVMIARGDLAVEIGFDRLAEMQEELLWLCEAAQVPVIWATQVLEHLVKKGQPSRGEMTDAAMAGRAECVMLNKGPHLERALRILDRLLVRMAEHQQKKTSLLRRLHAWEADSA